MTGGRLDGRGNLHDGAGRFANNPRHASGYDLGTRVPFPAGSPADKVAAFRSMSTGVWHDEQGTHEPAFLIGADGSYVTVTPDNEPTGTWFIDGAFADGHEISSFADGRGDAQYVAETILADGLDAYRADET